MDNESRKEHLKRIIDNMETCSDNQLNLLDTFLEEFDDKEFTQEQLIRFIFIGWFIDQMINCE